MESGCILIIPIKSNRLSLSFRQTHMHIKMCCPISCKYKNIVYSMQFKEKNLLQESDPTVRTYIKWIVDFEPTITRSASAVWPSEKSSINTYRKSTTRFPMSLRWSSYVNAPKSPKGAQKRKSAVFPLKSHFSWRKSATMFFLCENCQRQSCRAFIGLTIHAKIIGGGVSFYLKF